jgi:hypothetical protein
MYKKDKKLLTAGEFGDFYWYYFHHGQLPIHLHINMFTSIIDIMGTSEQKAKWIPLC